MKIQLSKAEIEALLVSIHLTNYEMQHPYVLIFKGDMAKLEEGNLDGLYSKLSNALKIN